MKKSLLSERCGRHVGADETFGRELNKAGEAVVQSRSHVREDFATPWAAASQASLSLTLAWRLPKFMSIELDIQWHPIVSSSATSSPFAFNLSQHQSETD